MTEHPGIQVTVREGPSAQLLPALATGDVDIVVGRLPGADMASISGVAVDHHKLYREDLCLVAGASHPLAGAARCRWPSWRTTSGSCRPHLAAAPRSSAASSTPACACPRVTSNRCRC